MKLLQETFVTNADKMGDNKFIQVRKEKNVSLYRRETLEGFVIGFEVFIFKTIQAGASLPGGGTVQETYESYPGGKAFGRSAWFFGGVNAEKRAIERYDALLKGKVVVNEVEAETVPVVRVVPNTPIKEGLKLPDKPFSQKELAAFNNIENYKEVYSDLQKMLVRGILKVVGERESTRGKPAKLFGRA